MTTNNSLYERAHRRRNPLTGRWVLVSPHRNTRPWHGETHRSSQAPRPRHDPACHLCPDAQRATGERNPAYTSVHVFDNDFPAVEASPDNDSAAGPDNSALFAAQPVSGTCRVICYSPDHDRPMSQLTDTEIARVVDCWADQTRALGAQHRWVQVFENKGEMMGCSNPHPHGQIWATDHLPDELNVEDEQQRLHWSRHGSPMLRQVADHEFEGPRQVLANEHWLVIVPYWATWPFETLLLPRFGVRRLDEIPVSARATLAGALGDLTRRYDRLFDCEFPYSMGWHGAPYDGTIHDDTHRRGEAALHWQLHAHFFPPLLRSATVRKFMVGYEMLAEPQRDLTPEQAAAQLRELATSRR